MKTLIRVMIRLALKTRQSRSKLLIRKRRGHTGREASPRPRREKLEDLAKEKFSKKKVKKTMCLRREPSSGTSKKFGLSMEKES